METYLDSIWKELMDYKGIELEYKLLPYTFGQGRYRGENTTRDNLITLGKFIRLRKPHTIIECGTLEARSTEYFTYVMMTNCPMPRKLITIDVPGCIEHIGKEGVSFCRDHFYEEVLDVRKHRLSLLRRIEEIDVIYYEGLVRDFLDKILTITPHKDCFMYQDASHLIGLLIEEWKIIDRKIKEPGFIICYDDMQKHTFIDWFKENVKGWKTFFNEKDPGNIQMWMEKI